MDFFHGNYRFSEHNKLNMKKIPSIKKDIKAFLNSEEGRVNRRNIAKKGGLFLALGVGLAGLMAPKDVQGISCEHTSHASHSSHGSHSSHTSHSDHTEHASHGSHGSHSSHGSCTFT